MHVFMHTPTCTPMHANPCIHMHAHHPQKLGEKRCRIVITIMISQLIAFTEKILLEVIRYIHVQIIL